MTALACLNIGFNFLSTEIGPESCVFILSSLMAAAAW